MSNNANTCQPGPQLERWAGFVAFMFKQPRTVRELGEALGIDGDTPYRYINALRAESLLYIAEWKQVANTWTAVYAWQPSVAELPDAPRPIRENVAA